MTRCLLAAVLIYGLNVSISQAQNQFNHWYFGLTAGLTFNSGAPTALTDGRLSTLEGCATISDPVSGELLFYTDGVRVWDNQHAVMPNGTELKGHWTSAQSALIVPRPGSTTSYFIFTAGAGFYHTSNDPNNGIRYSTVDMTANGGRGDVIEKNIELIPRGDATEMLNATRHCNGVDYWVIAHELENNRFQAYLVTDAGITDTVMSDVGSVRSGDAGTQSMAKFSPDGSMIAVATPGDESLELFDFDNETGVVSNYRMIADDYNYYAPEFSPDNTKLYSGTLAFSNDLDFLYQFDLTAGSPSQIRQTRFEMHRETGLWDGSQLQLGPDGKIYVSFINRTSLGVINAPNQQGAGALYDHNGVDLQGRQTQYGLPNCISSDMYPSSTNDSTSLSITLKSAQGTLREGESTQVLLVLCNNGTTDITDLTVDLELPGQLSVTGASFPVTGMMIPASGCDTLRFDASMTGSARSDTSVQICAQGTKPSASACIPGIDEEDCLGILLLSPVDTATGDYTFYLPVACPGTNDIVNVLFHSRRYTDTITSVEFTGAGGKYFEYAGSRPVHFTIRPTNDQYIPVRVKRHHSGTLTTVMVLTTVTGDVFRIKLVAKVKDAFSPIFNISEVRTGNRTLPFDTCLSLRNDWDRTIRVTDTTWYHGTTGLSRVLSPELPFVVEPGQSIELCLRLESSGTSFGDTLQLGGGENIAVCPKCAFHSIVFNDEAPGPISSVQNSWELQTGVSLVAVPLPGNTSVEVRIQAEIPGRVSLSLFDNRGRMLRSTPSEKYHVGVTTLHMEIPELPTGQYWVGVSSEAGTSYVPIRLVR